MALETAEAFASGFFRRHPRLRPYAPSKVVDKDGTGNTSHPEARQVGRDVQLFPKFWKLDVATRDCVFAHELGHFVLGQYGLAKLIADLQAEGVDAWDSSALPFGQGNMDEAFADSFASYFLDQDVQRRYPAWAAAVKRTLTASMVRKAMPLIDKVASTNQLWYHGNRSKYNELPTRVWSPTGGPSHEVPVFLSPAKKFAELYAKGHGYVYTVKAHVHKTFDSENLWRSGCKYVDDRDEFTAEGKKFFDDLSEGKIFPNVDDPTGNSNPFTDILKSVLRMDYDTMENGHMVSWLRKNGYDSFLVTGDGEVNLAVFDPKKIEIIETEAVGMPEMDKTAERVVDRFLAAHSKSS